MPTPARRPRSRRSPSFDPNIKPHEINLAQTYTNEFVEEGARQARQEEVADDVRRRAGAGARGQSPSHSSRATTAARYTAVRDTTLAWRRASSSRSSGRPAAANRRCSTSRAGPAGAVRRARARVRRAAAPASTARAGYMFQAEALMPWRTALANVAAGLEFRGVASAEATHAGARLAASASGCAASATAIRTSSRAACESAWRSRRR